MRFIKLVLTTVIATCTLHAFAQDIPEAYNLSNLSVTGTARSMGFGNTLGSVGGDFSSLSVNPAGIGVYRTSEFCITPSVKLDGANSTYLGNSANAYTSHLNFNNISLVFTNAPKGRRYDRRKWKTVSFGIGVNRLADFNNDYNYQGTNKTSSASQVFESDANLHPNNVNNVGTYGYLGANSGLIVDSSVGQYYSTVPFSQGILQQRSVQVTGGINEFVMSFGGNYKEKLMLGVTLGIPTINYQRNVSYAESYNGSGANPYNFSNFDYTEALKISGTGINLKFGAIYNIHIANDMLRIGAALHSPTVYNITDIQDQGLSSNVGGSEYYLSTDYNLPQNQFNYTFTTPWKGILSATFILKKLGFITVDYEYVDYSTMHYTYPGGTDNSTGLSFEQEQTQINNAITSAYKAASNVRVGAEIKLAKYFMVRGGFGFYGNPYKQQDSSSVNQNGQRIDVSCGLGFHFNHFFTDLGIVHSMYKYYEQPYSIDYAGVYSGAAATIPTAQVNYSVNNVAMTVGFKF